MSFKMAQLKRKRKFIMTGIGIVIYVVCDIRKFNYRTFNFINIYYKNNYNYVYRYVKALLCGFLIKLDIILIHEILYSRYSESFRIISNLHIVLWCSNTTRKLGVSVWRLPYVTSSEISYVRNILQKHGSRQNFEARKTDECNSYKEKCFRRKINFTMS